jgi:NTP pyrophosphatase (non-canonical NTP hydrolase)
MSDDLITNLQRHLDLPPLYEVDAASKKYLVAPGSSTKPDRFAQAAIPATIIALYAYSRTDGGALAILQAGPGNNWVSYLFTDKKETLIRRLASYSGLSLAELGEWINRIASETIRLIREEAGDIKAVKEILAQLRDRALVYLPPDLQLEELLNRGIGRRCKK